MPSTPQSCPAARPSVPSYDEDFYNDAFIVDPLPHYEAMRRLGPVVWLPRHGNYAVTRYKEAREALRNFEIFSSARGVAADETGCQFMKGNTVASDPPVHSVMRKAMAEPLLPGALAAVSGHIQETADRLIANLVERRTFEGMADLARHLPLAVVTELVGLPEDGRENMLKWAAAAFDILGIQNERGRQGVETIKEMRAYIQNRAQPGQLKPGSWTARIYELAETGQVAKELCPFLIRDYANPSLDTTISATGQLLYQLSKHPDQWDALRASPSLIPNAVNEAVRLGTPIRSFTRLVTQDFTLGGALLPAGSRVMILYASANRDEQQFANPDTFDVTRTGSAHVGFGHGIHTCVGMHLARLEMESLLRAMVPRVSRITCGTPTMALNNSICAFATLPTTFEASAGKAPAREKSMVGAPAGPRWLDVTVAGVAVEAERIKSFVLTPAAGGVFPPFEAGAHVDVEVRPGLIRQYSLCGDPADLDHYRIGVLKEEQSRGGSISLHDRLTPGASLRIGAPRNHFRLDETATRTVLLAGGIGVTPLMAMAYQLSALGTPFEFHYCARSRTSAAFIDELMSSSFGGRVQLHLDDGDEAQKLDLEAVLGAPEPGTHIYCCGPAGFIEFATDCAKKLNWPAASVHVEYFNAEPDLSGDAFTVVAGRSNHAFQIEPGQSILHVLEDAGFVVSSSCQSGVCGSCLTSVIEGIPDHRDHVQSETEKSANDKIAICCSRSRSRILVLDI